VGFSLTNTGEICIKMCGRKFVKNSATLYLINAYKELNTGNLKTHLQGLARNYMHRHSQFTHGVYMKDLLGNEGCATH